MDGMPCPGRLTRSPSPHTDVYDEIRLPSTVQLFEVEMTVIVFVTTRDRS